MKTFKRIAVLCLVLVMALGVAAPTYAASSYKFTYKSYTRKPGDKIGSIKKKWKVKQASRQNSCICAQGEDVVYSKSGLSVSATSKKKGGTEYINSITITSKSYKTKEGVKVGSSLKTLKKKYKGIGPVYSGSSTYRTSKGGVTISFVVSGNKVRSITYTK